MPLQIRLLGPFRVLRDDGTEVRFRSRKSAEIIAHLALEGAARRRSEVCAAIWPDSDEAASRRNLRTCMAYAKSDVGADILKSVDESLILASGVETDVNDIERNEMLSDIADDSTSRQYALVALAEALSVPVLEDWSAQWIEPHRAHYQVRYVDALLAIARHAESDGRDELTLAHARKGLERDPHNEAGVALAMRALARMGRVSEASEMYRGFAVRLESELNLEPSAPTRQLAALIRTGRFESTRTGISGSDLVIDLVDVAIQSDPERVVALLAAQGVSWKSMVKGSEIIPLLERVLESTTGWSPDRCRVAIDLCVACLNAGNLDDAEKWAVALGQGSQPNSYSAYVAAALHRNILDYRGETGAIDRDYESLKQMALAQDLPYQVAVCEVNHGVALARSGRAREGLVLILGSLERLEADTSNKGVQAFVSGHECLMECYLELGEYSAAIEVDDRTGHLRLAYGLPMLELGGSAVLGIAKVHLGLADGYRDIADGVTAAFRQNHRPGLILSLAWAAAALELAGDMDSAARVNAEAKRRADSSGIVYRPKTTLSSGAPMEGFKSELALVEFVWNRLKELSSP